MTRAIWRAVNKVNLGLTEVGVYVLAAKVNGKGHYGKLDKISIESMVLTNGNFSQRIPYNEGYMFQVVEPPTLKQYQLTTQVSLKL